MFFWGKVFGAFLGILLTGDNILVNLLGMSVGIYFGHLFDHSVIKNFKKQTDIYGKVLTRKEKHDCFFDSTFSVLAFLSKSKQEVTFTDLQVANVYLDLAYLRQDNPLKSEFTLLNALQTTKHRMDVQRAFEEGKNSDLINSLHIVKHRIRAHSAFESGQQESFSLSKTLDIFKQLAEHDSNILQIFLGIQIQLAFTDGKLEKSKQDDLFKIGDYLGFTATEVYRLLRLIEEQQPFYQGIKPIENKNDSYSILGIKECASEEEIKRAYRKMMGQFHPDKLASKGLSEESMQEAIQKTQDIQQAYKTLRK
jgi:DnaJ like chaperone protein